MKIMLDGMYATGGATLSLDTTHTGLSGGACFSPLSRERAGCGLVTVPEYGRAFLGFRRSVGGVFAFRAAARARRPGGAGPRRPGPGALSLTNPIRGRLAAFFAAFAPKCISPHARGRSTALLLLQRERSCYGKFIPVPTTNWLVSQSQRG